MIIGIGIDIIQINRIKPQPRLINRILSAYEKTLYFDLAPPEQPQFLAGRWSAKEAIIKALPGPAVPFNAITLRIISHQLQVTEGITLDHRQIHISLTHEIDYAAAVAVIESIA